MTACLGIGRQQLLAFESSAVPLSSPLSPAPHLQGYDAHLRMYIESQTVWLHAACAAASIPARRW